jgi:hypothetical protein
MNGIETMLERFPQLIVQVQQANTRYIRTYLHTTYIDDLDPQPGS